MERKTIQNEKEKPAVIREYKDSVFRMIFKEKKELLSLFNAINNTHYTDPDILEINTLENAVYMSMKNDISCVLDMRMNLFEHQSTINPNMPLRYLMYVSTLYEKQIWNRDLYSRKKILLPTPKFVVLYNGEENQPARKELRLSDCYMTDTGEINLELKVLQLNINKNLNPELTQKCQKLYEYTLYADLVRNYRKKYSLEKAVELAVTECIQNGILKEFLTKNRAEVIKMSIFEYNEELHHKNLLEEGREEGWKKGLEEGLEKGMEEGLEKGLKEGRREIYCRMLNNGKTPEEISSFTGESLQYLRCLQKELTQKND